MPINSYILDTLIRNQWDAIKYQTMFASVVVIVGICILIFSNFFVQTITNDTIKLLLNIGGGFISTISAYPISQIIARKEKMRIFQVLQKRMDEMTDAELKKVEELIWKSLG